MVNFYTCSLIRSVTLQISSLLPTLEQYWPTLSCGSTSQCDGSKGPFWGHEVAVNSVPSYLNSFNLIHEY